MNAPGFLRTWFRLGYCSDPEEIHDRGLSVVDLAGPFVFAAAIGIVSILALWALAVTPAASLPGIVPAMETLGQLVGGVIVGIGAVPLLVLFKYAIASGGEADA